MEPTAPNRPDRAPETDDTDGQTPPAETAVLLVNHDERTGHGLAVELQTPRGTTVFDVDRYLEPGEAGGVDEAVPAGEYELAVTLDGTRQATLSCRLGADPVHTAVVETGNGILSLRPGPGTAPA